MKRIAQQVNEEGKDFIASITRGSRPLALTMLRRISTSAATKRGSGFSTSPSFVRKSMASRRRFAQLTTVKSCCETSGHRQAHIAKPNHANTLACHRLHSLGAGDRPPFAVHMLDAR